MKEKSIIGNEKKLYEATIKTLEEKLKKYEKGWTLIVTDVAKVDLQVDDYEYLIYTKDEMYVKVFKVNKYTKELENSVLIAKDYLYEFFCGIECAIFKPSYFKYEKESGIEGWHESIKTVAEPIFKYFIDTRWSFQGKNYKPLIFWIYGGKAISTLIIPVNEYSIHLTNNGDYLNIYKNKKKIDKGQLIGTISNDFETVKNFIEGVLL